MSTTATPSPSTPQQTKISAWLPISAFIGTSLALAIPFFILRRQQATALRISPKNTQTPPPRRSATMLTPLRGPSTTPSPISLPISKQGLGTTSEPFDASSSPGTGGLISALSQMNQSTALLAAKAFLIATGLVAVGGITFTWAVKTTLGVEDAKEFGQKMRSIFQTIPGLRSRLYRPPETDDEYYEAQAPVSSAMGEEWNWAEAEERLNKAYEEGGITIWAQTALRELEAEARVERNKRDRQQEGVSVSGKKDPSFD
ncbi:hypothetical protein BYT27DRAFT_7261654 [Phlegmacium glaucopus]|nr:hypothetical protein BYT27DRAFT_7261654 [Phlegmacium glaucopus]